MTQEGAYLNFDLLIHREGPDFIARVTESPTGEASTCFPPPLEAFEAQHLRLLMVRSRGTVRSVDTRSPTIARDIGERLFKAAFKDDVHATYQSSLRLAEQQDKKLRIRLRLTEPEGAQLPWEYLRDPSAGGRFLALDDDTPIVRYMEIPQPARRLHVDGPIRILAVISAPTDRDGLDAEVEWANLQQALAGLVKQGAVTVERPEHPGRCARLHERGRHELPDLIRSARSDPRGREVPPARRPQCVRGRGLGGEGHLRRQRSAARRDRRPGRGGDAGRDHRLRRHRVQRALLRGARDGRGRRRCPGPRTQGDLLAAESARVGHAGPLHAR